LENNNAQAGLLGLSQIFKTLAPVAGFIALIPKLIQAHVR